MPVIAVTFYYLLFINLLGLCDPEKVNNKLEMMSHHDPM